MTFLDNPYDGYTDLVYRTRKLHQLLGELHADALAYPDLADTLEEAYTILNEFIKEEDKENENETV